MLVAAPARAEGMFDWSPQQPTASLGDWSVSLGANLSGAIYNDRQAGGIGKAGVESFAVVTPSLWRSFAGGWEVGVKSSFLLWHDKLSGDNYGNDVAELAYLYVQSRYGRVEIGQQNGTAYSQAVGVPVVDGPAAINDANVTFFKDRAGFAFNGIFNLRTGVFSSANDAKVNYISPRLGGFQISASFTPYQTKAALPWTMTGHHVADRVQNIWEGNLNYTTKFSDAWSAQASASFSHADDAARTPGHDDVWDWGAGIETDYNLDEGNKFSFGAAYRASNAYTFNVQQAFDLGTTDNFDIGGMWTRGPWIAGVEYETGKADAIPGAPALREWGWNPSVAYAVNSNLQLTLGWQYMHFSQSSGLFYNGKPAVGMNALYLHANFQI
jgi:hypothetical protein